MARGSQWHIRCDCGWTGHVELAPLHGSRAIEDALNDCFRNHLPERERRVYILVDQREGMEGNWIMPIGAPVVMHGFIERDGEYFGRISPEDNEGSPYLPIGEIRLASGKVYRWNDKGSG